MCSKFFSGITLLLLISACSENSQTEITQAPLDSVDNGVLEALSGKVALEQGIRDIKRVQRAYAQYLSAGKWQEASTLFSNEGVLRYGEESVQGINSIENFLGEHYGIANLEQGMLNEHLIVSPVINIEADGITAKGRWRLVSLQGKYGVHATWEGGIYENTYVNEDGIWKLSELHFYPIYGGDYASGWRMFNEEVAGEIKPIPFHYDADLAGVPVPASSSVEAVTADLAQLNAQAQRLLDEDAIISLQNAYGYYLDRMLWDDLSELFHQDGSLELGLMGVYQGRKSIRQALEQFGQQGLAPGIVFDHLQLQPIVTVSFDGMHAQARGTELKMLGVHGEESQWGLATFENTYVKHDGLWKIETVHVFDRMLTDYGKGWADDAQPALMANVDYAADSPSTIDYPVYPQLYIPEFSFLHPVLAARPSFSATESEVSVQELERKLRVLNAYDGAENISNAYGYYIDEFIWDGMADVYSVNGWKELSGIGAYVGRERVRDSVVSRYGRGGRRANSMTYHQKVQPVITVSEDGYSARIRTRLFQLNSSFANPGSIISGIYENEIVIEEGIWRVQGMDLDYSWNASIDGGWENTAPRTRRPNTSTSSQRGEEGPDRPLRGVIAAPYPVGQVDMAFGYLNPVSGRKPTIYLVEWDYEAMKFPDE